MSIRTHAYTNISSFFFLWFYDVVYFIYIMDLCKRSSSHRNNIKCTFVVRMDQRTQQPHKLHNTGYNCVLINAYAYHIGRHILYPEQCVLCYSRLTRTPLLVISELSCTDDANKKWNKKMYSIRSSFAKSLYAVAKFLT